MKLDFDISVFSRFFHRIVGDLAGHKRLWPVAGVLLAGIVAVPVLLTKSSSAPPAPQAPLPAVPPATGTSLPTINVQATPGKARINGTAHNPFAPTAGGATSSTSSSPTTASTVTPGASSTLNAVPAGTSSGSSTGSSGSSTAAGGGSSTTPTTGSGGGGTVTPPSITGGSKPKPAPTGLSSTQSYQVAMAITNSAGGVDTVDPLARLSAVPNNQQPLLVELGVLRGGSRVLFAVQPGTVVAGPGVCTPGPIDCEILSLGQDQTEAISSHDSGAHALFAITGVTAVNHASAALANLARHAASSAGRAALNRSSSSLPALSLFKYDPSVGAIVDLRDLTVGG
jgi:hypothetical protein